MAFSLHLSSPLLPPSPPGRILGYDLNADVTNITYSTALPGGYENMEVTLARTARTDGLEYPTGESPVDVRLFAHVQLYVGAFRAFEGRMVRINRTGGRITGFGVRGYGLEALTDDVCTSLDPTPRGAGLLLAETLTERAPLLVLGPAMVDTGVLHAAAEFTGRSPADMLNQFLSEGSADGSQWDYWVYEDRVVAFVPRQTPDVPDYLIPFDDRVQWAEDAASMTGGVIVSYQPIDGSSGSTGRITSDAFGARYGFTRTSSVSGGRLGAGTAKAYGQTYLALNSGPKLQVSVSREQLRGLETPGGSECPPWEVRAGGWLGIGGQDPLPIIRTSYDVFAGTLSLEAGQPIRSAANLVQQLTRVAGHVVRGSNVSTGARA